MSIKLRVLGFGLLAMLATSAFAAMNATASDTGSFDVEGPLNVTITGEENATHRLHLTRHDGTGPVGCATATYHGVATALNPKQLDVTPTYTGCTTTEGGAAVTVTHNGCTYRFTVEAGGTKGTAELTGCAGTLEVHHPNCTISVHEAQNQKLPGIHYTTIIRNEKHALTIHVDVTFTATTHGLCQFVSPTTAGARLKGTVIAWAESTDRVPKPRHLTAT